jgi:4-hydroxybenzoate polyprenyltransferase
VTRRQAAWLGGGLLAGGVLAAALAGGLLAWLVKVERPLQPLALALTLVAAILLYDGPLKRTWAGPLAMGACRFLNVLLGLSVSGKGPGSQGLHLAVIVGLYIVGVTWFARTEARQSSQEALAGAASLILAALALALAVPGLRQPEQTTSWLFPYLLVVLGFALGRPITRALIAPSPQRVQEAVRRSLMGLIVLDAILASALVGLAGLSILVLLAPSLYLARKRSLYAT